MYPQAPSSVVMIRPHHFYPNEETRQDNHFQTQAGQNQQHLKELAYQQVTAVEKTLVNEGVSVHLFEDDSDETPDSVFPNNWFSTHSGGQIAIYPMYTENRRRERRTDIIEYLKTHYRVQDIIDYSGLEHDELYLEGTGAMVLDHLERVAYAALSNRTNSYALERFCTHFNYEPMVFEAKDSNGVAIYHTNVLMCIGSEFVMGGFDLMTDSDRREQIIQRFKQFGRQVISLTESQINSFCGNAFELQGNSGRILVLSSTAFNALTSQQIRVLEQSVKLLPLDVSAIELAGGSIRCMLAGVHLSRR
ncbi:amidinotransferase [Alteromonadaceae bacterium M269]|nr:amidinotransferase [Alteromonadaceae bacterium M269]